MPPRTRRGASERFFTAVKENDIETVKGIIDEDRGYVNKLAEQYPYYTPLIIAAENNYADMVELLLAKGADVNLVTENGYTPLRIAIENNHADMVELLLAKGADIESPMDTNDNRPLYIAIEKRNKEMVAILLNAGAKVDVVNDYGYTPLLAAVSNNLVEIVKLLIAANAKVNSSLPSDKSTALIIACDNNKADIAKLLIEAGANVNAENKRKLTPLMYASIRNNVELVKLLLSSGANVNAQDEELNTPLLYAAKYRDNPELIDILLNAGADKDKNNIHGFTPLMEAINTDQYQYKPSHINVIGKLLEAGVDVNKQSNRKYTALLFAIEKRNVITVKINIVKMLLAVPGINVNVVSDLHNTPLDKASFYGYTEIVKLLLDAGAKEQIEIALSLAASKGHEDIVKLLLEKNPPQTQKMKKAIKEGIFRPDILALLKEHYKGVFTPWGGLTRTDIGRLDTIFSNGPEAANFSYCPICLKYVERSEACNYMSHNCSMGNYYHEDLYRKYRNSEGIISWCTICGRICVGHSHYRLVAANEDRPEPLIMPRADPFERDCRLTSGGGGLPEKLARFKGLRKTALELQAEVGKMKKEDAIDKLVEASWNAALPDPMANSNQIIKPVNWNSNITKFPRIVTNNTPAANFNDPTKYSAPKVLLPGNANYGEGNVFAMNDTVPIIVFKHKNAEGENFIHQGIGKDQLINAMQLIDNREGRCFEPACGGYLFPQEIAAAFNDPKLADTITEADKVVFRHYKNHFNEWMAAKQPAGAGAGAAGGRRRGNMRTQSHKGRITKRKATIRRHRHTRRTRRT